MAVHPPPPADLPSLVEAYRATVASFADVADGLREADWDAPTATPGWAARDHLAHVVHIEGYLSGDEHPDGEGLPPVEVGSPEHVRNEFGVWIEQGVRSLRDSDPRELTRRLRELMEIRSAVLYDVDLSLDTPVRSVRGEELPLGELMRLRLVDIWQHEQDLRDVVGRPGSLDSAAASEWTDRVLRSLEPVVLRRVRPEPGTVVIVESTGPVTGRAGVRISTDDAGELVAHGLFSGQADEDDQRTPAEHEAAPSTTIHLSTHALARRTAGRVSTEDTAYQVDGDEELAARVLDAWTLTP